jgi:hypothetical protein
MKLFYCLHCGDAVALRQERRSCLCGKSWGQYLPDKSTTVQSIQTVSIGLSNFDFREAVEAYLRNRNHFSPELSIRAWINPDSEPDVKYVVDDEEQEETTQANEDE